MLCPKCGGKSKVVNTRPVDNKRVRFRRCLKCKTYFYTLETHIPYETGEMFLSRWSDVRKEGRRIKDE